MLRPDEAAPSEPVASPAGRRRGRRGWWWLVVVLLVLIGRGLGWLGGGGALPSGGGLAAQPGAAQAATTSSPDSPPALPANEALPAAVANLPPPAEPPAQPTAAPAQDAVGTAPAAGTAHPAPDASTAADVPRDPAPDPARKAVEPFDPDRFASLLSLVRARRDDGQLGAAFGVLHYMGSLDVDAGQQAVLVAETSEVQAAFATVSGRLAETLRQGQVLAGSTILSRLLADTPPTAQSWLTESLQQHGLTGAWFEAAPRPQADWPAPTPLAKDRQVRVQSGVQSSPGRVVDSRADQVTVRMQGSAGVTFPTVAVVTVEPVDVTGDEACEMGLAALHAGEVSLARLWLLTAHLRCEGALPARGQTLAELLR